METLIFHLRYYTVPSQLTKRSRWLSGHQRVASGVIYNDRQQRQEIATAVLSE